jgi:hypothetical protein
MGFSAPIVNAGYRYWHRWEKRFFSVYFRGDHTER